MSTGQPSGHRSRSSRSQGSKTSDRQHVQQATDLQEKIDSSFEACDATASFFLHAQGNVIVCLHHDSLAVERRFEKHREDVLLISADNVSERGAGRLVVSYDAGQTAIVWDIFTGAEIARFASYEQLRVAAWMRDGSIVFGNSQGSIILFDPTTSEHATSRTIFDPVTALAPASDCTTFAIGYLNGSILIATLHPFTILHTLNTARGPSPITGLAWHGSSSKQKTEMLATQTSDGDLRVWSVTKPPVSDPPRIIRIIGNSDTSTAQRSWFAWSKNGRLVQYCDGVTRAWDVRTKKVTHENIPTVPDIAAISNYGPTATLFTVGPNYMIQQYDLNPASVPVMVANVQHVPLNAPPTPPDSIPRETPPPIDDSKLRISIDASSEDDGPMMSPFEKIAQEMDQMEQERRDQVTPLSPISSRASSRNSMSSASSYGRRNKPRAWERNIPSRTSDGGSTGTIISSTSSMRSGHDSVSIRSTSSTSSSKYQQSSLRQEMFRSPDEPNPKRPLDLFPFIKARLSEVQFQAPQYPQTGITPDVLRREMLSVVFGWDDDIDALIRDELSRHKRGSGSAILLSKWLGDLDAESVAQMNIGSETLSTSDWMLLALSGSMGQGSRQVGDLYARKLLEKDEVHSAVAILLGLGENNDAIEAYVSRKYFLEAVLLTCLLFPNDWQRQSYLVRKWGEIAVSKRESELAVRCFSCTSIECSEPWFSPRAQSEINEARNAGQDVMSSPAGSPQSAGNPNRLTTKNASLKLITSFGNGGPSQPKQPTTVGVTPILDSALSPGAGLPNKRSGSRGLKEPSSARTATPSGYGRKRAPSAGLSIPEAGVDEMTPMTEKKNVTSRPGSRSSNAAPSTAIKGRRNVSDTLPSPAPGVFRSGEEGTRSRDESRDRNHHNLKLRMMSTVETETATSPHHGSDASRRHRRSQSNNLREPGSVASTRLDDMSPLMTDGSSKSYKGRNIDRYISSLEEATHQAQQLRAQSRSRSRARQRDTSETRDQSDVKYIKPSKRSPSSPVPMSLEEDVKRPTDSPIDPKIGRVRERSRPGGSRSRTSSKQPKAPESPDVPTQPRAGSRSASRGASKSRQRHSSPDTETRSDRGRSHGRRAGSHVRSPSSPSPVEINVPREDKARQRSTSRAAVEAYLSGRRTASPERSARTRSSSRRAPREPTSAIVENRSVEFDLNDAKSGEPISRAKALSRKELAAKELEERRLSLARRPSAPTIPLPGDLRPSISPRSFTDSNDTSTLASVAYSRDLDRERSHTADPEHFRNSTKSSSQASVSTPKSTRNTRYGSTDLNSRGGVPAVPAIPDNLQTLAPTSYQISGKSNDTLAPLLPSTTYGQKPPLPRSNSAPPEQSLNVGITTQQNMRQVPVKGGHSRRGSERDIPIPPPATEITNSIDATISDINNNIIIVEEREEKLPPVLPELQHLAGPPPPPPPPPAPGATAGGPSGHINIAVDSSKGNSSNVDNSTSPTASNPAPSSSPNLQRRGRGSGGSNTESFSSKWKNVRDRMRSNSRNRTKSPPQQYENHTPSPYETQLPPGSFGKSTRSPDYAGSYDGMAEGPPPIPMQGTSTSNASSPTGGTYRNHKDIRAAIEQASKLSPAPGIYNPSPIDGGMI